MKNRLAAVIAAVCLAAGAQATHVLTPAQALNVRRPSDLQFSPDGARLAFTVAEPPHATDNLTHVWMLDVAAKSARQFTYSSKSENSPRWSPDGQSLAFLSNRGPSSTNTRQIYLMPASEPGEAHALTKGKNSIASFAWSPDGKQIAFLAADAATAAEDKQRTEKDDAEVMDHPDHRARIWLLDVASGEAHAVTPEADAGKWAISQIAWLPDGSALLATATDHPASDDNTHAIYRVNLASGTLTLVYAPRGPWGDLKISPDGKLLAYTAARIDGPQPEDVYVRALDAPATEPSRDLTATSLDRAVGDVVWNKNGSLWITAQTGFHRTAYRLAADGGVTPANLPANPRGLAVAANGTLAYVGTTATQESEVYLDTVGGAAGKVTDLNASWSDVALAQPSWFHFASFDRLDIEGELLKPRGNVQAPYPTVILVHGGPTGVWSDSVDSWGQLLAAHGFAVAYFNIRGSTGYGYSFVSSNRADWGGADFRDVMAGVDYLEKQGIADPHRLGIGGWSYGGYMSEWAITQTDRFQAAVSGAGMVDLITEFSSENGPSYDRWFWGLPYEHSALMLQHSPLLYLQHAHTPILILQGQADTTDPLDESTGLYRGLKYYGAPAELVEYPRENHGFREEEHQIDRLNRIVAWYEKYLGAK